jgi:hypothetical protein
MKLLRMLGYILLAAVCAIPIVFAVSIPVAHAADGTTVDLSPTVAAIREYLVVGIDALIAAAIGWVLRWVHLDGNVKVGQLADQARAALHSAVENGIDKALAQFGMAPWTLDVRDQALASIIDYAQTNAASALGVLVPSPGELSNLIVAKLGARGQAVPSGTASVPAPAPA